MQPLILVAGKGTRMGIELPKTLFEINGKPMLDYIIETLSRVPEFKRPMLVVGYGAEHVKKHLGDGYQYAHQPIQNGTASAVAAALPLLPRDGYVFIMYGDQPFVAPETFSAIAQVCQTKQPTIVQSTVVVPDFEDWRAGFYSFSRMLRDESGSLAGIVQLKNTTEEERAITELDSGLIAVEAGWLHDAIPLVHPNPEYYLTELVSIARAAGKDIQTVQMQPIEALGINSHQDAEHALRVVSNK